jgi:hypothetical protein
MAEFDGLDGLLRDALGRAAEQGDSTGVADAIRSRVAAGDAGPSVVTGTTAPGWGGGGVLGWLPWLGLIVVAALGGTALGASGALGVPVEEVSVLGGTATVASIAPAYACPGGPQIGQLHGGDRVVAVQRSDDTSYLGVRNPYDVSEVLWLDASAVVVDAGQPDVSTLPVGACPAIAVQYGTPTPTPEPEPGPTPDTTPPTIGKPTATPGNCHVVVTVTASDNVGVASVTLSWTGPTNGSAPMQSQGGGTWRYEQGDPGWFFSDGNHDFVAVAQDAAGNSVQSGSATANLQCLF